MRTSNDDEKIYNSFRCLKAALTMRKKMNEILLLTRAFLYSTVDRSAEDDDTDYQTIAIIVGTVVPSVILLGILFACLWRTSSSRRLKEDKSIRYGGINICKLIHFEMSDGFVLNWRPTCFDANRLYVIFSVFT